MYSNDIYATYLSNSSASSLNYYPVTYTYTGMAVNPPAGHVPDYEPPAVGAETELEWLRRRVVEVTDLCPAA